MEIYTDGGKERYCFVIPEKNVVKTFEKKGITNNEAEYLGVIEALKFVEEGSRVKVLSDSELIVNQIRMEWHVKSKRLIALLEEVFDLVKRNGLSFEVEWVPRKENKAGKVLG